MKKFEKSMSMKLLFGVIIISLFLPLVSAAASFQITSFSCSPSEIVINNAFSCTAQIKNIGDASGSVSTATLYPDADNWLENSNYPQASGTSVGAGQTAEITFAGLKAIKSGNKGFARIMLDSVTDNYVSDNNIKVNVINVIVTISNSASSAVMGGTITTSTEVSAGGNIDVSLTFASDSGGCSVGSQTNPKTISGMTDGSKQSKTWTITQGTSGSCAYTISAAATGVGGIASKIDSSSSTITCTDCPVIAVVSPTGGSSGGSGGGGGGGGGSSGKNYIAGELDSAYEVELAKNDKIQFNISNGGHILTLINLTETSAKFTVESTKQTFTLNVGEEVNIDLTDDNNADIAVKLKSVNIITNKAMFILKKIAGGVPGEISSGNKETNLSPEGKEIGSGSKLNMILWIIIITLVIIAITSLYYFIKLRKQEKHGKQ